MLAGTVLLLSVVGTLAGATSHADGTEARRAPPVVVTPLGRVRGAWLHTRRARPIRAFRGLRYAEAPVGNLRFEPPQPITQYASEVDASAEGPACPQPTYGDYYVHEDCLRLNVYAPENSAALPVIVFMHAGGFYSVSGRSDVAGPHYLLDRDIVLVTINYRLASLGFMSTGDELVPGNNGFKDQVTALRWVQRNIASFGGDPGLVTIAGYSAGSFSVMLHIVSPMSEGLFHRAISMSGSPISQVALPPHQRHLADRQARLLNCTTASTAELVACLRTKSSKEIGDSLHGFFDFLWDPVLIWVPVIEPEYGQERFLTEHPLESVRHGRVHNVPYIVSQTTDEFFWKAFSVLDSAAAAQQMDAQWAQVAPVSFCLPPPAARATETLRRYYLGGAALVNDSATRGALGKLYSDAIIGFGVHTLVNAMSVYTALPLYYCEFAYIGNRSHYEDPVTEKPVGAAHHDDLLYLFGVEASFPLIGGTWSRDARQVARMTALWARFAATGDPNIPSGQAGSQSVRWPRFTHSQRQYLRIDKQDSVREKLFEDRFQVWEKLYSPKNCDYCTY